MKSINISYLQSILKGNNTTKDIIISDTDNITVNCNETMIHNDKYVIIINNSKVLLYKKYN